MNNNYLIQVAPSNWDYTKTASYVNMPYSGCYSNTSYGIKHLDDGVIHYSYHDEKGEDEILDDIEKNGYVILGEDEDEHWYDVIKPEDMERNMDNFDHEKQLVEMGLVEETLDIPIKKPSLMERAKRLFNMI
jgi:hypothetical protein